MSLEELKQVLREIIRDKKPVESLDNATIQELMDKGYLVEFTQGSKKVLGVKPSLRREILELGEIEYERGNP
jgi:hypothetical protein